jgi:2-oxoglutarate ferredoxin oxidoreductase subunit alpha
MVKKRLKKLEAIEKEIESPKFFGNNRYLVLVIAWGSNLSVVKEAVERMNQVHIAFLHINQIYPFHESISKYLKKARVRIVIENNATSQLSQLIKLETGVDIDEKILKFNGLPFQVEEVIEKLNKCLRRG